MPDIGKAYVQIVPRADGISDDISKLLGGGAAGAGSVAGASYAGAFGAAAKKLIGPAAVIGVTKAGVDFMKDSIQLGMTFDSAMSQVAATMGTTVDQIGDLRDAARQAGRSTKYTAEDGANALNYMALAGYDAETSMSMLPTVLNLAAAGGMDLAIASDMITDSQSALNLSLDDTRVLVDQMARASSRSNTSVAQLGEAILTVGGNANFMKGGTEELTTVLGILADNGIKGAEGGTHLRNMLLSLSDPTKDARDVMDKLGVSIFDADGNMRAFADFFPELKSALSGLTSEEQLQALAAIFNTRDIAAANALLDTSAQRYSELGGAIGDSAGAAQQMADVQMDNLEGDVLKLKSAFGDLKLEIAEGAEPAARKFVQSLTNAINGVLYMMPGATQVRQSTEKWTLEDLCPWVTEFAPKTRESVDQQIPMFLNDGLRMTQNLGQGFNTGFSTVINDAKTHGLNTAGGYASGIDGGGGRVGTASTNTAGKAKTPMQNAGTSASDWGLHMGMNFARGLAAAEGPVGYAANRLASAAAAPLRHSVPSVGPLSDDDVWGLHMAENLIRGMQAGEDPLRAQSDRMAGIVRDNMRFDAGIMRADVRGTGTQAGGSGNEQVIAELRQLQQAIRGMGVYLDSGRLIGAVDGGIGRVRVSKERRSV